MPKYIKSHSNFRLSSKHQTTNSGTIYERDITTIGGISPLAAGQSKIYSSGNFIMTINNETGASRHIVKKNWLSNGESGATWNGEVLQTQTSDINASVELSKAYNNDYLNLQSFACYGSLYMLIQNAISGIIDKFPYEIYSGDESLIAVDYAVTPTNEPLYEISNPGGIDMITSSITTSEEDTLKYFTNGGSDYYEYIGEDGVSGYDFTYTTQWHTIPIVSTDKIANKNLVISEVVNKVHIANPLVNISLSSVTYNNETYELNQSKLQVCAKKGDFYVSINNGKAYVTSDHCPAPGEYVALINITVDNTVVLPIHAIRNNDTEIAYLVTDSYFRRRLRPKDELGLYDEFIDSLDNFQKALMGVYSKQKYAAKFEVYSERNGHIYKTQRIFNFPLGLGNYNIETQSLSIVSYIQDLAKIGLEYDEKYTDNLYRLVTHESLKNFDWTRDFNGNDNDYENEYVTTGEKFKDIIRIMGFNFDKEKSYIDSIGNVNTLTYDDRSNLSDYFITDSLNTDGWITNNIYPYELQEFKNGAEINSNIWDASYEIVRRQFSDETSFSAITSELNRRISAQTTNEYDRRFSENNTELINPYKQCDPPTIETCVSGQVASVEVGDINNSYYQIDGEKRIYNIVRNYCQPTLEYTMPDVTNQFLKRLRINSKQILRKKGTIEGIESVLSLLGLKSRKWCDALQKRHLYTKRFTGTKFVDDATGEGYIKYKFNPGGYRAAIFDFDIKEYTEFTNPIAETWDKDHSMYRIDYLNSCKTIPYTTEEFLNGEYVSYQGLPVAYRDIEGVYLCETGETTSSGVSVESYGQAIPARRLYPDFMKANQYDGGLYYQMKGGWMSRWPYFFADDSKVVINTDYSYHKETLRSVKQVNSLRDLTNQNQANIADGMIYYVNDVATNYGIIDGSLYELKNDVDNDGNIHYYIIGNIQDGSLTIGDTTYFNFLRTYDPYETSGNSEYYLTDIADGTQIKLYYNPISGVPFNFFSYSSNYYQKLVQKDGSYYYQECDKTDSEAIEFFYDKQEPLSSNIFLNGVLGTEILSGTTNYFLLRDITYNDVLGENGWIQLTENDTEYQRINVISDNYEGNNPHDGEEGYDNGYEYISYFSKLFKYASLNRYFNEECFSDIDEIYEEIDSIGFSGLSDDVNATENLGPYIHADKKIHSFVNTFDESGHSKYTYDLNNKDSLGSNYSAYTNSNSDGVTSQIFNTKLIDIIFYTIAKDYYSKAGQEEIKHYHDKVMPYVEQMVPSTAIMRVRFIPDEYGWILDPDERFGTEPPYIRGYWKDYFYWQEEGVWYYAPETTS